MPFVRAFTTTLALPFAIATACVSVSETQIVESMRLNTSIQTRCPESQIAVRCPGGECYGQLSWAASACGRQYTCAMTGSTSPTLAASCRESAASEQRSLMNVVIDRLALESGCPKSDIQVVQAAEWQRGSERAYRLRACGHFFICTTAAGRTDCKQAMSQSPAARPLTGPASQESPSHKLPSNQQSDDNE